MLRFYHEIENYLEDFEHPHTKKLWREEKREMINRWDWYGWSGKTLTFDLWFPNKTRNMEMEYWDSHEGKGMNGESKDVISPINYFVPYDWSSHTIPRLIREMAVIVRRLTVPSWVFLSDRNSILNIRLNVYHFWIQNRVPSDPINYFVPYDWSSHTIPRLINSRFINFPLMEVVDSISNRIRS